MKKRKPIVATFNVVLGHKAPRGCFNVEERSVEWPAGTKITKDLIDNTARKIKSALTTGPQVCIEVKHKETITPQHE